MASSNSIGILPQRNTYNLTPVRPLTPEEKKIVITFRVFLIRNFTKVGAVLVLREIFDFDGIDFLKFLCKELSPI